MCHFQTFSKIIWLVYWDKPTIGYFYELMDRDKEVIHVYYRDKEDEGFHKWSLIQRLILWAMEWYTVSPHSCYRSYHIPTFSYSCGCIFDAKVIDGFLTCIQKMVPFLQECVNIYKEMEIYIMADGTCGFHMAIQRMNTKMLGKLNFISNFIISLRYDSTFNFQYFFLCFSFFCRFMVDKVSCKSSQFPNAFHLSSYPNM